MQLVNVAAVVLAVIVQRLANAQVVARVAVEFALELRRVFKLERTISRAASDKLRLGYRGISG